MRSDVSALLVVLRSRRSHTCGHGRRRTPEFFDWLDRTEDKARNGTNPQTATRPRS